MYLPPGAWPLRRATDLGENLQQRVGEQCSPTFLCELTQLFPDFGALSIGFLRGAPVEISIWKHRSVLQLHYQKDPALTFLANYK